MASKCKITSFFKSETQEKDKKPKTRLNYCQLQLACYVSGWILYLHNTEKLILITVTISWRVERLLKWL